MNKGEEDRIHLVIDMESTPKLLSLLGVKSDSALEKGLPSPVKEEGKTDFISRFMQSPKSLEEFPDRSQRYAVAVSAWNDSKVSKSEDLPVEKARLPLWGSTAGKSRIAKRIVKMIPEHDTYVEPFAGGAAVFYTKQKDISKKEVLADINPEVAFSFKFARDATNEQITKLKTKNWVVTRAALKKAHFLKPTTAVDRFYRFTYKRAASFFRVDRNITGIDPAKEGKKLTIPDRVETTRDRLKGVHIYSCSYEKLFSDHDSASSFFYLDPPYPRRTMEVGEREFDEEAFIKNLKNLKGKFLLHYDAKDKKKFEGKGWNVKTISVFRTAGFKEATKLGKLLEVTNYVLPKEAAEAKKVESYVPPKAVQAAAAKGLELRRTWERGGLDVSEASEEGVGSGVQRATNLKNSDNISLDTIKRMRNFFSRHQANYRPDKKIPDGGPTAGTIAWLLWGGDPGKDWVSSILADQEKSDISWVLPIAKVDEEERLVTGIVLEPNEVDAQNDTISEESIKAAAYKFVSRYNKGTQLGFMHKAFGNLGISLVESWVAREGLVMNDSKVKKGSWLMTVHVTNEKLWARIKEGKVTGFSIGGVARVS